MESHPLLAPSAVEILGAWGHLGPLGVLWEQCDCLYRLFFWGGVFLFFSFCLQDIFIIKVKSPVLLLHISVSLCSGGSPCHWLQGRVGGLCVLQGGGKEGSILHSPQVCMEGGKKKAGG